jgi:alkanesulfonate monooxygenase SsuD/methylene tetrahydromethanopterin reductase-like flavin-dependent oxidoreductase (luciferase family)
MTLRVGVSAATGGSESVEFVREAERLGADSVWSAEFWAGDAFTPLAFLAAYTSTIKLGRYRAAGRAHPRDARHDRAIASGVVRWSVPARIGTSGPRVMEGWHGVAFDRPIRGTRETIEIVRTIARGERLDYHGEEYRLPLAGSEGHAIRSRMRPMHIPIYIAALGPANLRLAGELADGWIGTAFLPETAELFLDPIRQGATTAGRGLADLDLTVAVPVEFTDDIEAAGRHHAEGYAFTIGAMGSATTIFYNNAFARQGYGDDIREVRRLWLAGERDAARRRVPAAIGLGTNLIGTDDQVLDACGCTATWASPRCE